MGKSKSILLGMVVWGLFLQFVPPASAAYLVATRDTALYGRTYGEWVVAWNQWAFSIPVPLHPLFDGLEPRDASVGQTEPVWFLGGRLCAAGEGCNTKDVVRNITISTQTALFFPIVESENSTLEHPEAMTDPSGEINRLRQMGEDGLKDVTDLHLTIDGIVIPLDNLKVQSPPFIFTLPVDNLLKAVHDDERFAEGVYFPAVATGYFVMIYPFPQAGRHTVRFGGMLHSADDNQTPHTVTIDITYNINVE